METLEPILHAFCTPTPDRALAAARRIEAEIMAGNPVGPLAGDVELDPVALLAFVVDVKTNALAEVLDGEVDVAVGVLLIALAIPRGRIEENFGGWNRYLV